MSRFAVIREGGPRWDSSRTLREQEMWDQHAAFMDALEDEGFVVLGGPLDGGPKTLLIAEASGEEEIRRRLGEDPWAPLGLLTVASVEPWEILLGKVS